MINKPFPKLKEPYLLACWPGMGNVALRAGTYLKNQLKAEELAELETFEVYQPAEVAVQHGLAKIPEPPRNKFYFWKNGYGKNDLIIFLSEAQPDLDKGYLYGHRVLEFVQRYEIKKVFTFAAMPVPITHLEKPKVWAVATDLFLLEELRKLDVQIMPEGQISGLNGLLLGIAKQRKISGICLLGELPLYTIQIENPRASQAVLEILTAMLGIKIDYTELENYAKRLEEEIEKLFDFFSVDIKKTKTLSEEDVHKMRKTIEEYTKIPPEAKKKIEELFEQAKKDSTKITELKVILDKWGIFKEYEDKFLDLFEKRKEQPPEK
jgi:hypothetical protein